MIKHFLLLVFFLVFFIANGQKKFGNEWIDNAQNLYKIKISEKGIYRITYDNLKKAIFPVESVNLSNLKLFHHGKEVPILVVGDEDGVFGLQDYIEFYAEGNNGELDSLLYRPNNARMNPFNSLYADEAFYFLTFGITSSKRTEISSSKAFNEALKEAYHLEQQVKSYNEQYSFNNSIGYPPFVMQSYYEEGEGWSSKIITADSLAKFPIKLENYLPQQDFLPTLECLFNGRTETVHDVKISIQNNQGQLRTLGQIDYFGFSPLKIVTNILSNEITADRLVQLRSQSSKKDNVEWHSITYHKVIYPQSFEMLNKLSKYFYLLPKNSKERHVSVENPPHNALVYQIFDRYSYRKINASSNVEKLNFVVDNTFTSKSILVSSEIKSPELIEKVNLNNDYTKTASYLIITHPSLRESADEFASYRASEKGGSFLTNVVEIQDLYLNFSYGERTPLAIRRFIDFQLSKGTKLENLLLIGRGKSFPDALKTDAALDLIPTIGYPGSDILLTAGLNNYDVDVQAIPTGRLNVVTNQEVLNYLQKVKDYESNTSDLLWKKNVLHLNGGLSRTEVNYFKDILKIIEPKIQKGFMAGKVEVFSKKTDNSIENIDISEQLNRGLGMITFIGHASATTTDLNIGFASSSTNKFQNKVKYPLMFFNGCGVGNVFNKYDLLTTDWLLTPEKGAIAIFANSFWSYDFPTSRYLNNLYEKLFEDPQSVGESIGKIQQLVNAKIKSEGADLFMLSNIHQLILQGDPALKVFPLKTPDYQVEKVFLTSKNQTLSLAANDSVVVGFIASNFGKYLSNTTLDVLLKTVNSGKQSEKKLSVINIAYRDTFYVSLKKEASLQSVEIQLDPNNIIVENNETNNNQVLSIDWSKANTLTVYPADALPDRLNPVLDVYFDEKKIRQNEYVAANASIKMILADENTLSLSDTAAIRAFIQSCENCVLQPIYSKNLQFSQINSNQIEARYILPNLVKGKYKLIVDGRDAQKNRLGNAYEIGFQVADEQRPTFLLVYPNPAEEFCNFQFQIVGLIKPKSGIVSVFDSQARLVQEITFSPKIGQNDVFWNRLNTSAGIYAYRAIIEWQDGTVETFEGKIVAK